MRNSDQGVSGCFHKELRAERQEALGLVTAQPGGPTEAKATVTCPHRQPPIQQGVPGPEADIDTPGDRQVPTQHCARAPPPPHLPL